MLVFLPDSIDSDLLLKATTTKSIFVPGYTRSDGTTVPGHTKIVHFDPDKDLKTVLSGGGSHSQKAALKKLEKLDHWHLLEDDHKHAHVLSSATNIQNKASTAAAISGWKKSAMAGKNPTLSQWKAFDTLSPIDKQSHFSAVAGKLGTASNLKWPAELVTGIKPASASAAPAASAPVVEDKPATAPASSNPWTDEQWAQLYLSDSNSNAPSHNKKIDAMKNAADAGDVEAIKAMKFGSNTYGKKQAKISEHLIAELSTTATTLEQSTPESNAQFQNVMKLAAWQKSAEKGINPTPEQWAAFATLPTDEKLKKMKSVQKIVGGINHLAGPDDEDIGGAEKKVVYNDGWEFQASDPAYSEYPSISTASDDMTVSIVKHEDGIEVTAFNASSADLDSDDFSYSNSALAHLVAHLHAAKHGLRSPSVESMQKLGLDGPEEGDIREVDGVSYILKNGRWHSMEDDEAESGGVAPEPFDAPAVAVSNAPTTDQYQLICDDGKSNKFWTSHVDGDTLVVSWGKVGTKGQTQIKAMHSHALAKKELSKKLKEKIDKGYIISGVVPTKTSAVAAAPAQEKPQVSSGKSDPIIDVAPHSPKSANDQYKYGDISGWKKSGGQLGSNDGGVYTDKLGAKWYCKFPGSAEIAKSEFLATKFYQMFGLPVPKSKLIIKDGKIGIASKWDDSMSKASAAKLAKAQHAHTGFVFDAWLANWDVVGLGYDNLLLNGDGAAVRLDNGGALEYRAQGGKKGDAFGDTVPELDSLLDGSKNATSAAVFKGISKSDLMAGVSVLAKLKPSQIDEMCEKVAIGTLMDQSALAEKLKARREFILKKFDVMDPWNKPKPDLTKLRVSGSDVPKVIDFENYNGPGKGLSSKEWLNKQNATDSAALIKFAEKGNLVALKDYHYDKINKETGENLGKAPILEHPSAHVKEQWVGLVELLTSIAYPPTDSLAMPPLSGVADADDLASSVGFFDPTDTVETVASEHRLGFFMKVDMIEGIQEFVESQKWGWISPNSSFVQKAKQAYGSFTSTMKAYISGVQSSGWVNHVWSQGKKIVDIGHHSIGVQSLASKVYSEAIEMPENTQLWRWMNDTTAGKSMTQQLIDAKPGLVLQNTNSMCASYQENWGEGAHFGSQVLMLIRCPKGSKATPSFASGAHSGEKEVTTLPGARFVVVSTKKGVPGNPNGVLVDVVMLPPHEGYISSLKKLEALGKSLVMFFRSLLV